MNLSFNSCYFFALATSASQIFSTHGEPVGADSPPFNLAGPNILMDLPDECLINNGTHLQGILKSYGIYDMIQVEILGSSKKGKFTPSSDFPDGLYHLEVTCSNNIYANEVRNESDGNQGLNEPYHEPVKISLAFRIDGKKLVDPTISESDERRHLFDDKSSGAVNKLRASGNPKATRKLDQVFQDDVVVDGSLCVGIDCGTSESFGSDTIRLKENNLRIKFEDTSSSSNFPSNDWKIQINESNNGGESHFAIKDATGGKTPFKIEAGAPASSLHVDDEGKVGIGTSTPAVLLHGAHGNTPTLRLEQDGSSGFTPQIWDISSNESNFFVRDTTNGSKLPFRIIPGAPDDALYIDSNGNIGMGKINPDKNLHIKVDSDIETTTIRLDTPSQNWDIAGDDTKFCISDVTSGDFLPFQIETGAPTNSLYVTLDGDVGIGTNIPNTKLHVVGNVEITGKLNDIDLGDVLAEIQNSDLQELSLSGSTLSISGGTGDVDLSYVPSRVMLQASVVTNYAWGSFSVNIKYGGDSTEGWTMIMDGTLLGISVAFNNGINVITGSDPVIKILQNGINIDAVYDWTIPDDSKNQHITFTTPVAVSAGDIIKFEWTGSVDDNNGNLVLLLEQ